MTGVGGGMVAIQFLFTIKEGTSPFNYQPTEPFSTFLWQHMAILKFLSDVFRENATCVWVCGGGICLLITLTLKNHYNWHYNLKKHYNWLPSMSSFWSSYDISFYKKCPGLKNKTIYWAHVALYLGSAIALLMIFCLEISIIQFWKCRLDQVIPPKIQPMGAHAPTLSSSLVLFTINRIIAMEMACFDQFDTQSPSLLLISRKKDCGCFLIRL
jgi:hypothetical protein